MASGGTEQTSPPQTPHRSFAVGVSFRTADSRLRDRLYVEEAKLPDVLEAAKDQGLGSLFMLSTCDRVEIFGTAVDPETSCRSAERFLLSRARNNADGLSHSTNDDAFYRLYDIDAARHIFRIASALDSQMVGESQILGQLKSAIRIANDCGMIQGDLEALTQAAFALAKRVRATTRIGEGAVSAAAAAVKVGNDLHGDLKKKRALQIGLGETAWLITEQFQRAGIGSVTLTGPARRTEREASRRGLTFRPFDAIEQHLVDADVLILAAGQGRYLIDRPTMQKTLDRRKSRPVLIVDAGVPSDVDPAVDHLDDAFLYTLEDIERLAEKGQLDRQAEAQEAEAMVEAAVAEWRRTQAAREGVPGLVALRDRFDELREEVLRRHPNAGAEEATRLLVNRLLHEPSEMLREIAAEGDTADLRDTITVNRVLERLFALNVTETKGPF